MFEIFNKVFFWVNSISLLSKTLYISTILIILLFSIFYLFINKQYRSRRTKELFDSTSISVINSSIIDERFLVFSYLNEKTIVKPIEIVNNILKAYCYIKNCENLYEIVKIKDIEIKNKAYSIEYSYYDSGIEIIKDLLNQASISNNFVCIRYQRPTMPDLQINSSTGKRYFNGLKKGEVSIRTISNIKNRTNTLNIESFINYDSYKEYITAYCHSKNEERTFKVNRIKKVSVLNI